MAITERELKKYLQRLVAAVELHLKELDALMKQPSTVERGKQIARSAGALEMAKDQAKHFGLGVDLRKKGK